MKDLTTFTLSVIQELEDEGRFGTFSRRPERRSYIGV